MRVYSIRDGVMNGLQSTWTSRILCWTSALSICWTSGCSSPEFRIKRNPELFSRLPAEKQEKIRSGEIDIGFTPDLVQLALGKPHRVYTRTTEFAEQRIWSYSSLRTGNFHRGYYRIGYCYDPYYPYRYDSHPYLFSAAYSTNESARVIFVDGLVAEFQILDTDNELTY